jgi:hypothetical protein
MRNQSQTQYRTDQKSKKKHSETARGINAKHVIRTWNVKKYLRGSGGMQNGRWREHGPRRQRGRGDREGSEEGLHLQPVESRTEESARLKGTYEKKSCRENILGPKVAGMAWCCALVLPYSDCFSMAHGDNLSEI